MLQTGVKWIPLQYCTETVGFFHHSVVRSSQSGGSHRMLLGAYENRKNTIFYTKILSKM